MSLFKPNTKAISDVATSNLPPHLKATLLKHYEKLEHFGLKELDAKAFAKAKAKADPFHPIHAMQ